MPRPKKNQKGQPEDEDDAPKKPQGRKPQQQPEPDDYDYNSEEEAEKEENGEEDDPDMSSLNISGPSKKDLKKLKKLKKQGKLTEEELQNEALQVKARYLMHFLFLFFSSKACRSSGRCLPGLPLLKRNSV